MLSQTSFLLLKLLFGLYALLGVILFFMPTHAAGNFAWRISPFIAMTIGGWCLGTAWAAAFSMLRPWAKVAGPILYLALFGLFQGIVLIAFLSLISLRSPLAWLYLAAIAATVAFAASAAADWTRTRPVLDPAGERVGPAIIVAMVIFFIGVGVLAAYALTRPAVVYTTVFPEPMSLFSLRSFGALYAAIALATVPLMIARKLPVILTHGIAMYGLIVFILLAALWFIGRFDFATYPLQSVYVGAYVAVGIVVGAVLLRRGTASGGSPAT